MASVAESGASDALELHSAYDLLMKMIIIGESGTGKSCLLHHFIHNQFKEHAAHTIGVEFSSRVIRLGNKHVKLQLWDTAGQERFRSVTRSYYRGASACLLVYDVTNRASFEPLARWLSDARALASPELVVVLVGNKLDRAEEHREVGHLEASRWAGENGALFLETSSLTGENVEAPFQLAARSILVAIESGRLDPETPGSGISYGDRSLLRRTASGSRFSFADVMDGGTSSRGRRRMGAAGGGAGAGSGVLRLGDTIRDKLGGCC